MQPSACTFADYNHLQASKIECDAVVALATKESSINVILYYDTTSKNSTDGEWLGLILNISDKQKFGLRPLVFAYKDREQITNLRYLRAPGCCCFRFYWDGSNCKSLMETNWCCHVR